MTITKTGHPHEYRNPTSATKPLSFPRKRETSYAQLHIFSNVTIQIPPIGIQLFNQFKLPFSSPPLDPRFTQYGFVHLGVDFKPYKAVQPISAREPIIQLQLMPRNPRGKIIRHSGIHGAPLAIGHDINVRCFHWRVPFAGITRKLPNSVATREPDSRARGKPAICLASTLLPK